MSLIEKYDFSYRDLPITTGMIGLAREMNGLRYAADNPNTEVRQIVSKVFQNCYWWHKSRRYVAADCFRIASGGGLKKNGDVHITVEWLLYELSFILFGNSLGIHFSNIYSYNMDCLTDFLYAYSESKFVRNMILQACKNNELALPWKCEEYKGKLRIVWVFYLTNCYVEVELVDMLGCLKDFVELEELSGTQTPFFTASLVVDSPEEFRDMMTIIKN